MPWFLGQKLSCGRYLLVHFCGDLGADSSLLFRTAPGRGVGGRPLLVGTLPRVGRREMLLHQVEYTTQWSVACESWLSWLRAGIKHLIKLPFMEPLDSCCAGLIAWCLKLASHLWSTVSGVVSGRQPVASWMLPEFIQLPPFSDAWRQWQTQLVVESQRV